MRFELLLVLAIHRLILSQCKVDAEQSSGTLVVGGKEAPQNKYAFTVGLRTHSGGESVCGGSLIAPRYVLTAAHCLSGIKYASIGSHTLEGHRSGQEISISRTMAHPAYGRNIPRSMDFAIVELANETNITTVLLAQNDTVLERTKEATVLGWGATTEGGGSSDVLLELDISVLSNSKCNRTAKEIDDSMLCAGGKLGEDSCEGDSGGPLIVKKNIAQPILVGVVSWGRGCGRENIPGVYARVSKARCFIDKYVHGHQWY